MNNIELSTIYLPILDEVYKEGAKTSVLDGDETTVRKGNNGEIKIAKLDMDALGDFDRKSGYTKGSTSLTWETVKYDKERSQDLRIDRLDNDETLVQPFAKLSSEFLRTKVIPETDAARIAKICGTKDITVKEENIETGAELITALRACANKMDEDEVPMESRILFITPTLVSLADDMTLSAEISLIGIATSMSFFAFVIINLLYPEVCQSLFQVLFCRLHQKICSSEGCQCLFCQCPLSCYKMR